MGCTDILPGNLAQYPQEPMEPHIDVAVEPVFGLLILFMVSFAVGLSFRPLATRAGVGVNTGVSSLYPMRNCGSDPSVLSYVG